MSLSSDPNSAATCFPALQPFDEHNQELQTQVHPADWQNPKPDSRYNLVVVGAGTAGLVCAAAAAGLGAKVALVERELMGGDCLNVGCVPSKAILAISRRLGHQRELERWGITTDPPQPADFQQVMNRMRKLRAGISPHDSAARFRELGVDVFFGSAEFQDATSLQVGDRTLTFKKAVIATGGRARVPDSPGLDDIPYLTNETLFSLEELPKHLVVVGGGPIGCEMAQAFCRLGAKVTLLEASTHVLAKEDADAAAILQTQLKADGITIHCDSKDIVFEKTSSTSFAIRFTTAGGSCELDASHVLMATGRTPNVENLGLEQAGVNFDLRHGVQVDDFLQTSNKNIFAAGDVCGQYQFTHAADFMARTVIQNALFPRLPIFGGAKASRLLIPWCTYTQPEIAHVGLSESAAAERGAAIDTYTQSLEGVDRAILEGETSGFVKVHCKQGSDQILGATIVAPHAGDLICEIVVAMQADRSASKLLKRLRLAKGFGLSALSNAIHPYPTTADAIRKLGDQYNRTRLTPLVEKWLKRWMAWTR